MNGFLTKKISNTESLGQKLAKYRKEKGLSREKAARAMNINVRYLEDLEKDNFDNLPPNVYTNNILKNYAILLELNPHTAIDTFEREKALYSKLQNNRMKQADTTKQKILRFILNPKLLKYLALVLILVAVFFYIGYGINKITAPPKLEIFSPAENTVTTDSIVKIVGKTEKEVTLAINDRPLFSDPQGNFTVEIDLQKGLNIIKISATKKHSRQQTIYRQVIVKDAE